MAQLPKIPVRRLGMRGSIDSRVPSHTPQQIADAGGWWGYSPYLTGSALAPWQEYRCYRETMAEARWRKRGIIFEDEHVAHLMGGRFELITPYNNPWNSGDGLAPLTAQYRTDEGEIEDWTDWIPRIAAEEFAADVELWRSAGWQTKFHWFADNTKLFDSRLFDGGLAPCHYWGFDWTNKVMTPTALLAQIDHPDYLDWLVEQIAIAMRWYGADAIQLGWKHYYLVNGRVLRPNQTLEAADGSTWPGKDSAAWISRCPLALDQVIAGTVGITERLAARGISIAWAGMGIDHWMPGHDEIKAAWLGQVDYS